MSCAGSMHGRLPCGNANPAQTSAKHPSNVPPHSRVRTRLMPPTQQLTIPSGSTPGAAGLAAHLPGATPLAPHHHGARTALRRHAARLIFGMTGTLSRAGYATRCSNVAPLLARAVGGGTTKRSGKPRNSMAPCDSRCSANLFRSIAQSRSAPGAKSSGRWPGHPGTVATPRECLELCHRPLPAAKLCSIVHLSQTIGEARSSQAPREAEVPGGPGPDGPNQCAPPDVHASSDRRQRACRARRRGGGKLDGAQPQAKNQTVF